MTNPLLLSLIIYGLLLASFISRQGDFLVLAGPFLLYLAAGLLFKPAPPRLGVERTVSTDRAAPNEAVEVTIRLTNEGPALDEVDLKDKLPQGLRLIDGTANTLTSLAAGQSLTLSYTVQGQRGLYRFSEIEATSRDQLGLFAAQAAPADPAQFLVMPALIELKRVVIRPRQTGVYAGQIPIRQGGPGVEFFGVREYQPGDPLRWINERASARHQQRLFVNEFKQERVADVGLILDARRQSDARRGPESLFEQSIQATAALATTFISDGNRVGLFIYGRSLDWTFPGYGKSQRERILRRLAQARQGGGKVFETLDHLPTRLFPARSQLVLISPLLPQDPSMLIRLRARGYRLLVISPDPIAFEQAGLADSRTVALASRIAQVERTLILNKLRQADIRVVDWQTETPFIQIARTSLSRLPRQRGR